MASGKELRTKIKSVENTKKITKAMDKDAEAELTAAVGAFKKSFA